MSSTPSCNWNPPEISFIKCNIDGALFKECGLVEMSSVIRNHMGAFVAARAERTRGPLYALLVEALCCRAALGWLNKGVCKECKLNMIFKCLSTPLTTHVVNIFTVGLIILYCKELMTNIPECSLVFVKHLANRMAHLFARAMRLIPSEVG